MNGDTFVEMFGKIKEIFGLGKKEARLDPLNLGELITDIHSHFIPGIDDGAQTMDDAIDLLREMQDLGYQKVITTPHIMSDYYRNTPEIINGGLKVLTEEARKRGLTIKIVAAAEYYFDADLLSKIKTKQLLTFGDNYVLFELPFMSEPPGLAEVVFEMQLMGYKPVLAHPERYTFWHGSFEKYQDWFDRGVVLQLNINSITGHYSPQVKKVSQQLIDNGLIQLLGSDCHHEGHLQLIRQAITHPALHKLVNSGQLLNSKL